jgi:hypothetical protein
MWFPEKVRQIGHTVEPFLTPAIPYALHQRRHQFQHLHETTGNVQSNLVKFFDWPTDEDGEQLINRGEGENNSTLPEVDF